VRKIVAVIMLVLAASAKGDTPLLCGFAEVDVTPALSDKPVFIAGFGFNRRATAVHDPIMARVVVIKHGDTKVAIVSVDLVGLFYPQVERIRAGLPGFTYVLVSSTHNHEGPDSLGLWGANPFTRGSDPEYLRMVEKRIIGAVSKADDGTRPVTARIGRIAAPELLRDSREPYLKHDELVAIEFRDGDGKPVGVVVQWNCHPETLDSANTKISADFVAGTVAHLKRKHAGAVVYLTGTVGGLMTSLDVPVKSADGRDLADGTFEKTERYGQLVGMAADKALESAKAARLTPLAVRRRPLFLPIANKRFLLGSKLGVVDRPAYLWTGDSAKADTTQASGFEQPVCLKTEVAWLRLGELDIVAIPGEVYPELVLGRVQDPVDPGADFPEAPVEPGLYAQLKGPYRMIVGLANDEIGYIIPKRQWDEKPPYCYGRKSAQYGEINSLGPETAPLLCEAFRALVK
jgi:hypothetical protein